MKHVKIMNLPDCDKLVYCSGTIAHQIGTMFVVDDEKPTVAESFPILSGGRDLADGWVTGDDECYETPVVCRVGEIITPKVFASFVKRGMHEEVPTSASELYEQLRENGSDLQLPVIASTKETIREYSIELEINDFKDEAFCYSTDTAAFYFEAYFKAGDKDELYRELMAQLMDYMNILDTEELGAKITFRSVDFYYQDVIDRLNETPIDTINCDMYEPRKK